MISSRNTTKSQGIISIWIGSREAYAKGVLRGKWLALPMQEEALKKELNNYGSIAIFDFECPIKGLLNEYTDPMEANNYAEVLKDLEEHDFLKIKYLIELGSKFEDAQERLEEVIIYEGDLENVAAQLIEEGCFGEISKAILPYIDYEMIVRDLKIEGYYYERESDVTFYHCA